MGQYIPRVPDILACMIILGFGIIMLHDHWFVLGSLSKIDQQTSTPVSKNGLVDIIPGNYKWNQFTSKRHQRLADQME